MVACSVEALEAELMKYLKSCLWQEPKFIQYTLKSFLTGA